MKMYWYHAFLVQAFENELEYHYLYVQNNNSDDQATSDINSVGFWPVPRVQLCTTGVDQQLGKYIYVRQFMFRYYLP